jgi:hypothetical protein
MFENPWPIAAAVKRGPTLKKLRCDSDIGHFLRNRRIRRELIYNARPCRQSDTILASCTLLDALISLPWIMSMTMYLGERYVLKHSSAFRNSYTIREIHTDIQMREIPR